MNLVITLYNDEIEAIIRNHFAQKGFHVKGSQMYADDNDSVRFDIQLYADDVIAKEALK
ncbi:hypothetical protein [Bacillus sp. AF23]|uniref:hypothetical protein n=1 Tax=Bacillus sp. AF23 TaxID=2821151 RepID=UPI001E5ADF5D|nr:hypothetical protein [Bacillus sp. AF23]MCC8352558.1 hypothetical protein [Bacillus sp. AF23]